MSYQTKYCCRKMINFRVLVITPPHVIIPPLIIFPLRHTRKWFFPPVDILPKFNSIQSRNNIAFVARLLTFYIGFLRTVVEFNGSFSSLNNLGDAESGNASWDSKTDTKLAHQAT